MTAAEHQHSELRPNEHPTFTRRMEALIAGAPIHETKTQPNQDHEQEINQSIPGEVRPN